MGGIATSPLHSWGSPEEGTKSKVAASPLPCWGPISGWNCSACMAFFGAPEKEGTKSKVANSPLLSWWSIEEGKKSQVATSPVPSREPTSGRNCYLTLAFLGVSGRGDKIKSGCITPAVSVIPRRGEKIKSRYITFLGAHKWAELLPLPCVLGGPQVGGIATSPLHSWGSAEEATKSKVATSPLPSRGPTGGRNCYLTLAFLGVSGRGDKIKSGYITLAVSVVPRRGVKITSGYITPAFSGTH